MPYGTAAGLSEGQQTLSPAAVSGAAKEQTRADFD
jgi:hypothetical protein